MWFTKPLKRPSSRGSALGVGILLVCVVIAGVLFLNRQFVVDQISVWQYQPSEVIKTITERSGMGDKGKFYFYAAQPSVEDAPTFNKDCSRKETATAILGCYNGRSIFIYNVTDTRLDGIKEVTAAHEMLHATYLRLGSDEKSSVNALLEAEYAKLKNSKDFAERMAFYDRTEPGERDNELHSIIGTEVSDIDPGLETYYKKYFDDRQKVTALQKSYAKVFSDLQKRGDYLSAQLSALGDSIETASSQYNSDVTTLNHGIAAFNAKARGGGFASSAQFQAERAELVARANDLNARRQAINADIARYNELRDELVSIASQSEALNKSIDSSLAPAPSL